MSRRPESDDATPPTHPVTGPDFRALYHKLQGALADIERRENVAETLERILEALVLGFRHELGFTGGRMYRRDDDGYFLCCGFGGSSQSPLGLRVPPDYPPHVKTLEEGVVIVRKGDPGYDEVFERSIGVDATFAAITVGKANKFVISLSIDGAVQEERVLYSLTAVRQVINMKLDQEEFTGMLEESRAVQESMLPSSPAEFAGFDLAGRSRPAEQVGGDLFDYLELSSGLLGLAIADASGHGLPAALIARDAITGLRTLADEEEDLAHLVARLNRVIHRAALSRKFVSLVYGRLHGDGAFEFCNAGHPPPLLNRRGVCAELRPGGPVLGPIPEARYVAGRVLLEPGSSLVLYTDGVVEREDADGQAFGAGTLCRLVESRPDDGAAALVDAIFAACDEHAAGAAQADDMTVVVVRRL